jgi:cytochrome c2
MKRAISGWMLLLGLAAALAASAVRADAERGRLLYENHCQRCHTSVVHVREQRKATTPAALRGWIDRWSADLKLGWTPEDSNDVYQYLNHRYYRLPVEAAPR